MAMLTFWFFYEGIRVRPFHHKYLTAAAVTFCAAYLSWEGSVFILPALFLALLVVRWGEWWWLKEWHLYRCVFFSAVLVIAELCWRTLASDPYTAGRFWTFQRRRTFAFFSTVWMGADVLRGPFVVVGEPCRFSR